MSKRLHRQVHVFLASGRREELWVEPDEAKALRLNAKTFGDISVIIIKHSKGIFVGFRSSIEGIHVEATATDEEGEILFADEDEAPRGRRSPGRQKRSEPIILPLSGGDREG